MHHSCAGLAAVRRDPPPINSRQGDKRASAGQRFAIASSAAHAIALLATAVLVTTLAPSVAAMAIPTVPSCSWPLETTGTGLTNVAYPDTDATYWTMQFDSSRWRALSITGIYPEARFFSFVTYDTAGAFVDDIVDVDIKPDALSTNPFNPGVSPPGFGNKYSVLVSPSMRPPNNGNLVLANPASLGWVIYRVYVPDKGEARDGGVELPVVSLIGFDGKAHPLPPCGARGAATAASGVGADADASRLATAATVSTQALATGAPGASRGGICAPDKIAFAIPENTGGYFPNPANKYIAGADLCFKPGRIVVVRGQGAIFPNTYNGYPVWLPPAPGETIEMRYWSMCNNNQTSPYPVIECAADWATNLDEQGYYTYVVSADDDPPAWVPPVATWLPWGSKTVPNILIFRNMLPASGFAQSVQAAAGQSGCTFNNQSGVPTPYSAIVAAGKCDEKVMGSYYPVAAYCDKALFIAKGWQGCFAAVGIGPRT
ncbi:MAG: hypothetical protein ABI624_10430 [Casimicrobiaceae bacterium]